MNRGKSITGCIQIANLFNVLSCFAVLEFSNLIVCFWGEFLYRYRMVTLS